jgi:hypothetical protein
MRLFSHPFAAPMHDLVRNEYRTTDDVVRALQGLERHFLSGRDLRGVFATAYLEITRAIHAGIRGGGFQDAAWTTRYLVAFANLYRVALRAYEEGRTGEVPKAWRLSFDAARAGKGLVIQHLVLGINAHINHDLALGLLQVGIDPERPRRYADHTQVNRVLEAATAGMKLRIGALYAPILNRLDRMAGRLDDEVTAFSIPKAREHAWTFAVALTAARDAEERRLLRRALDDQAAVLARLVLASPTRHPVVVRTVRIAQQLDALARRYSPAIGPL